LILQLQFERTPPTDVCLCCALGPCHPIPPTPYLQVNASGTAFAAALESLPLDELELGSLRGVLVGAVMDVDLQQQTGRLTANLASPRFSGLAGTSLSTAARYVSFRDFCIGLGGGLLG
jgi:hypothetical protein